MKVFISWSGARSNALAVALKDWLPLVLQYVEPWVSEKDISGGDRWAQAIAGELESSNFGILCVTPENLGSEWLLFEAGALSKSMQDAKVIPLLLGLELSDLSGPLSQFQALKVDQQGMMDVVRSINQVAENKASEDTINQLVPALWEKLQIVVEAIPNRIEKEKSIRSQKDILEELVTQVRGLNAKYIERDLENTEEEYTRRGSTEARINSRYLEALRHVSTELQISELSLPFIAGSIRQFHPGLADLISESYRDLKSLDDEKEMLKVRDKINIALRVFFGSSVGRDLVGNDRRAWIMSKELPSMISIAIDGYIDQRRPIDIDDDIPF